MAEQQVAWPAEAPLRICVSFGPGSWDTYIYCISGKATTETLCEMEKELRENEEAIFERGSGDYLMSVSRYPGQYGPEGRCEISPGWEFDIEDFRATTGASS